MGNIDEQKLAITDSFNIFGGIFSPIYHLKYRPKKISIKLTLKSTYGVHFIYPKVSVLVAVKE